MAGIVGCTVRSIARLVGLGGGATAGEADEDETEKALEAYLRDEDPQLFCQDSDVESDDDVGGLVQEARDHNKFPLDEFSFEPPTIEKLIPGARPIEPHRTRQREPRRCLHTNANDTVSLYRGCVLLRVRREHGDGSGRGRHRAQTSLIRKPTRWGNSGQIFCPAS